VAFLRLQTFLLVTDRERWGFGRGFANQQIRAAAAVQEVGTIVPTSPHNLEQARELAEVAEPEQRSASAQVGGSARQNARCGPQGAKIRAFRPGLVYPAIRAAERPRRAPGDLFASGGSRAEATEPERRKREPRGRAGEDVRARTPVRET